MRNSKIGSEDISHFGSTITGAIRNGLSHEPCELIWSEGVTAGYYTAVRVDNIVYINGTWQGSIIGDARIAIIDTIACKPHEIRYGSGIVVDANNVTAPGWHAVSQFGNIYSAASASHEWMRGTFSFAYYI